ncbi:MAG: alpha/beta hydrolase [Candidatus Riflebacteria bacterium]|nr:alpha/beta hydrolase [Candidatus Riflebacteria bacterium]
MGIITGRLAIFAILISFISQPVMAGPLRDLIMQYRAKHKSNESLINTDSLYKQVSIPQGVKLLSDIHYGSDSKHRMDVYVPDNANNAPVIFMVHGGAWTMGDKIHGPVVENKVARWLPQGFIFISINYRLSSVNPLQQADDVIQALTTAQKQVASWGGDPEKFILMGHSAGAHLVALLAADPSRALKAGAKPWLGTILLDSAALDVPKIMENRHFPFYDRTFGKDTTFWQSTSPFHVLSASAFPILAICSTRRDDSCSQAKTFIEKATSLGIHAKLLAQDLSHGEINKNLGTPCDYTQSVEEFMKSLAPAVMDALKK